MRALIDETEYLARHARRERWRRAAAGAVDRSVYLAEVAEAANERGMAVLALRSQGLSWSAVAAQIGTTPEAARKLVARMAARAT